MGCAGNVLPRNCPAPPARAGDPEFLKPELHGGQQQLRWTIGLGDVFNVEYRRMGHWLSVYPFQYALKHGAQPQPQPQRSARRSQRHMHCSAVQWQHAAADVLS